MRASRDHVRQTIEALRLDQQLLAATIAALELLIGSSDTPADPSPPVIVSSSSPRGLLHAGRRRVRRAKRPGRPPGRATRPPKGRGHRMAPRRKPAAGAPSSHAAAAPPAPVVDGSEAAQRRAQLLEVIRKSEVGFTYGELKAKTPKMDDKDRANALSVLKSKGAIRRVGNTWALPAVSE